MIEDNKKDFILKKKIKIKKKIKVLLLKLIRKIYYIISQNKIFKFTIEL